MLRHLFKHGEQTVSDVADAVGVPHTQTSQYLRALNARGLLRAERDGRWVYYQIHPDETIPETEDLLKALKTTFRREKDPVEKIFRLATAFTHPRRQEIFRALEGNALNGMELVRATGIPIKSMYRHLMKLIARGFVRHQGMAYVTASPGGELADLLCRLAREAKS